MALTTTNDVGLGRVLREWRDAADMTLAEMGVRASDRLPRARKIGYQTVHRYETGQIPDKGMDPLVVAAITRATGHELEELPDKMRDEIRKIAELTRDPVISSLLESPS